MTHDIKTAADVARLLDGAKSNGRGGFVARCPVHDDRTPSLSIDDSDDGKILAFCHGCGATLPAVLVALGVTKSAGNTIAAPVRRASTEPKSAPPATPKKKVAEYDYISKNGELIFQVVRYDPKDFRQRAPSGDGWVWNLKGVKKFPPYRLPQLIESKTAVFVCEGEKDADAVAALGVTATTFAGGAGKWRADYAQWFSGRHVVLLPDNDDAGRAGMAKIAVEIFAVCKTLRIVTLPTDKNHGDASDWISAGGTREHLAELTRSTAKLTAAEITESSGGDGAAGAASGGAVPAGVLEYDQPVTALDLCKKTGFIDFPDTTSRGAAKSTIDNTTALLNGYGMTVRYNVIKKSVEINIPNAGFTGDNFTECSLALIESLAAQHGMPTKKLAEYMLYIADHNQYNPVLEWIGSRRWDGVSRFDALVDSMGSRTPELTGGLLRRWLLGAVTAVSNPNGIENSSVLVLQGDQNIGKTSWLRALVGGNRELFKEGAIIAAHDKDTILSAIKYWIVEVGELDATFRKSDIAALKSFISRDTDEIRRPFSRAESKYPRRSVFGASVNPLHFLHDDTGNRRFWTVACTAKMNPHHGIDVQQLWAEVMTAYNAGEKHELTRDESALLRESNTDFQGVDPIEELIYRHYDMTASQRNSNLTASDVLLSIGYDRLNRKQVIDASTILRKITGEDAHRSGGRRVFRMPEKLNLATNGRL